MSNDDYKELKQILDKIIFEVSNTVINLGGQSFNQWKKNKGDDHFIDYLGNDFEGV